MEQLIASLRSAYSVYLLSIRAFAPHTTRRPTGFLGLIGRRGLAVDRGERTAVSAHHDGVATKEARFF